MTDRNAIEHVSSRIMAALRRSHYDKITFSRQGNLSASSHGTTAKFMSLSEFLLRYDDAGTSEHDIENTGRYQDYGYAEIEETSPSENKN